MKEDILLELSVYGQTQGNVVLNLTTGLRNDCFRFQRRLRRNVGCGTWRRHEQKLRFGGEERGNRNPNTDWGARQTHAPLLQHWCNRTDRSQEHGTKIIPGSQTPDSRHSFDTYHVNVFSSGKSSLSDSYSSRSIPVWSIPFYYRSLTELIPHSIPSTLMANCWETHNRRRDIAETEVSRYWGIDNDLVERHHYHIYIYIYMTEFDSRQRSFSTYLQSDVFQCPLMQGAESDRNCAERASVDKLPYRLEYDRTVIPSLGYAYPLGYEPWIFWGYTKKIE